MAVFSSFSISSSAIADSYDDQIAALKQQVAQQQATQAQAQAQANTAQAQVDQYNAQINQLNTQIRLNQAQYDKVSAQVEDAKAQMERQKQTLAANLKSMYIDSGVTPLEMIASSNNLSDFFNQQQYQDSIKSKIQDSLETIQKLKAELEAQQAKLTQLLADQHNQQASLDDLRGKANAILVAAQQNAAAADAQVKAKNSQISSLKSQQLAALAARYGTGSGFSGGGSCGGGYPSRWCSAAQDTLIDSWGMYNRECVSYTAFRVAASGRYMPYWGGAGNANQWPGNARAAGIPVDGSPRVGDVAISLIGPYGHAMYVEAVMGSSIHVSQYNYGTPGTYSEMTISSSGLQFIHF